MSSANLHWSLTGEIGSGPIRLGLSESDKADLIAFLGTLTDEGFVGGVRYSDPFE